jgi:hypothetical protein
MSGVADVGDAVELTYSTAPGATVTMSWIYLPTSVVLLEDVTVSEQLADGNPTGQFPVTLTGPYAGMYEAVFTATGTATNTESYYLRFDAVDGPAPLATIGEYTDLYGGLSEARAATARALLKRASQLIRDTYPGIDTRIAAGTVPGDSVGLAVLNMVARVMRNPNGLRSETTGPFSRAYDPDAASGMLQITEAEVSLLVPPGVSGVRGKMGSTRITGGMVPAAEPRDWRQGLMFGPGGY